jgi:hypothetical protein
MAGTDLYVMPIHPSGAEQGLPGLHSANSPRRAPRNRRGEQFFVQLALGGTATIGPNGQAQLLDRLAQSYFQTSGSVTSAMKAATEALNQFFFDRNLREANKGLQIVASLTLCVLRTERLYVGQAGPVHLFAVDAAGCKQVFDTDQTAQALGLSRAPEMLYTHVAAEPGTLIVLTRLLPESWTPEILAEAHGRSMRSIHKGLVQSAGSQLEATVFALQSGEGRVHLLAPLPTPPIQTEPVPAEELEAAVTPLVPDPLDRPVTAEQPESGAEPESSASLPNEIDGLPASPDVLPPEAVPDESEAEIDSAELEMGPAFQTPSPAAILDPQPEPRLPAPPVQPGPPEPALTPPPERVVVQDPADGPPTITRADRLDSMPTPRRPRPARQAVFGPMLLAVGRAFKGALRQIIYVVRAILSRLLPGADLFTIPSSVMGFTAVAVPLVLVTIAMVVYLRRGRLGQYDAAIADAQAGIVAAETLSDPTESREAWQEVVFYLDQAEAVQITNDTQSIRLRAQSQLDQLDGAQRLTYQLALVTPLDENVQVVRMAATTDSLYMLDANSGSVLRAWRSGRGYELDLEFACGPGQYGGHIFSDIVDMAALPSLNSLSADLVVMDGNGNIAYCRAGRPLLSQSLPLPDSNWGNPSALALNNGNLYILDVQTNAVWIFVGDEFAFVDRPRLFFDEQVPSLQGVIDFTIDGGELYLLFDDGGLVTCSFGFGNQLTRCEDPAVYVDSRLGTPDQAQNLVGTSFTQVHYAAPPDPSIYILDPFDQSLYHFSLKMNLQRLYRPQHPALAEGVGPPGHVTATTFAVSPQRTVFLAVDGQVYIAALP